MKLHHFSPSSLGLFCASPALFVLEKVLGRRMPVGVPAHRGTAVEAGLALGLLDPSASLEACIAEAQKVYDQKTALSGDPRREEYRRSMDGMIATSLAALRPYGIPTATQGFVEWKPDGVETPIIGYLDFEWAQHGIRLDLKTSERVPSEIKTSHARQVSFYAPSDNYDARLAYVAPKKHAVYQLDNIADHREALRQIALSAERFLALSDDPEFFRTITAPDVEHFYWSNPVARQAAFEVWRV